MAENLRLWGEMQKGSEEGLQCCVRAKIDMKNNNGTLRHPCTYPTPDPTPNPNRNPGPHPNPNPSPSPNPNPNPNPTPNPNPNQAPAAS